MNQQALQGAQTVAIAGLVLAVTGLVNVTFYSTTQLVELPDVLVGVAYQNQAVITVLSVALWLGTRRARHPDQSRAFSILFLAAVGVLLMREDVAVQRELATGFLGLVYILIVALMPYRPWMAAAAGVILTLDALLVVALSQRLGPVSDFDAMLRAVPALLFLTIAGFVLTVYTYQMRVRFARTNIERRNYARALESKNRELEETQLQLVQSEKMAALGNLVAGVAHEINTPMGAIIANADLTKKALDRLESDPDPNAKSRVSAALRSASDATLEASRRISAIVRSLRSFARLDESDEDWIDLAACVATTLPLIQHQLNDRIQVSFEPSDSPRPLGHPNQMNQVLMNLLTNAVHAIESTPDKRGRITIRTSGTPELARLEVTDDGIGISSENLPRVFDPGFTTKGVGVGTGLGLSIAYRIVRAHGGDIRLSSALGSGTTVTVELPTQRSHELEVRSVGIQVEEPESGKARA